MKNIYYYTPLLQPIASNGSERFGVNAVTQIWRDGDQVKAEVTMHGSTKEEANRKLLEFLAGDGKNDTIEIDRQYFFCSETVIREMKVMHCSKPLDWCGSPVYVALLNFPEVEVAHKKSGHPDFWCRECVPGSMHSDKITIRKARRDGLFNLICNELDLSTERNIAMIIRNMANLEGITPIELFNKIAK